MVFSSSSFVKFQEHFRVGEKVLRFNPLNPNSDENEFSLHIITTCSNIEMMRIKKMITEDKTS